MTTLLVALVIVASVVLVARPRHAGNDWNDALRLMIMLDHLEKSDGADCGILLSQVRIGAPVDALTDELQLVRTDGAGEPQSLLLDRPVSEVASRCCRWRDQATPLLLAVDDFGAVLQGPDASVLGYLIATPHAESVRAG